MAASFDLDAREAIHRLKSGGLVALPTETVYGLAADASQPAAIRRIFEVKGRPTSHPLIVHVASLEQAHAVTREWPPIADFIARWFWPGPLTVVLPKAESVEMSAA